jgi:hypothetical protein
MRREGEMMNSRMNSIDLLFRELKDMVAKQNAIIKQHLLRVSFDEHNDGSSPRHLMIHSSKYKSPLLPLLICHTLIP